MSGKKKYPGVFPHIEKPNILEGAKQYPFMFPPALKKSAKIVCSHRDIVLADYIREAIEIHNKKYANLLFNS